MSEAKGNAKAKGSAGKPQKRVAGTAEWAKYASGYMWDLSDEQREVRFPSVLPTHRTSTAYWKTSFFIFLWNKRVVFYRVCEEVTAAFREGGWWMTDYRSIRRARPEG